MAELQVKGEYGFPPQGSRVSGQEWGTEALIYSPPINYNWRIFAGELFAHGNEPNNEGQIGYSRSIAGVEYRNFGLTADIAPTFNLYHNSERAGVAGKANYEFNDHWSMFGGGELFSRQTPLRALNAGVTADQGHIGGEWRESESRSDRLSLTVMPYSDG